jgi:hypothetical protein
VPEEREKLTYTNWRIPENEDRLRVAVAATTSLAQTLKY